MSEKILVVDDDVDSLKLIGLMLQRHGYEVVAANTGTQALAKADAEHPDLIILDVMMPDMNGYDVCRRLRNNPKTKETPIIMFTAKTLIDDKVAGFEAGADDYLTKPTHPAELASRVKAVLLRSAAQKTGQPQPVASNRGLTIGVLGAKGGVGTTTLALNLATAMLQSGENPIAVDFRPGHGSMGLFIGFARAQGMARLLKMPPQDITPRVIEKELVTHQTGLRALLASANPKDALEATSPESAAAVVRGLTALANPVVCDMGCGYDPMVAQLQSEMDRLLLVIEPNAVALKMARELLQELGGSGSGRVNVVVVNRAQSSLQTPWHEVEQTLGQDIKAIISAAPELAFQAIESGMPLVGLQPGAVVAGQIIKLAEDMKIRIKSIAGGRLTT